MPIVSTQLLDLSVRCSAIELLLVDVDGVMTNGVIAIDARGEETKYFNVRDGSGFQLWRKAGKRAAILSGRRAPAVDRRAAELGIASVIQGATQKGGPFRALLNDLEIEPHQVCYLGDDLTDIPVLRAVGLAVCPADACKEVRDVVHLIASCKGGCGVIREIIEVILKRQGVWDDLVEVYQNPA